MKNRLACRSHLPCYLLSSIAANLFELCNVRNIIRNNGRQIGTKQISLYTITGQNLFTEDVKICNCNICQCFPGIGRLEELRSYVIVQILCRSLLYNLDNDFKTVRDRYHF